MNWYVHADGLGSITALTNTSGTIVQAYTYDSFGNITISGSISQPFTYTAREYDAETGMYFYRARYYDPKVGRFVTKDPIGFESGDYTLYVYVKNNPMNFVDPFGLFGDTWTNTLKKCNDWYTTTKERCMCFCAHMPIADTTECEKSCNACWNAKKPSEVCKCLCILQGKDECACKSACK